MVLWDDTPVKKEDKVEPVVTVTYLSLPRIEDREQKEIDDIDEEILRA